MPRIIPRSEWGARAARGRTSVSPSRVQDFIVHYDDARPTTLTGFQVPRNTQNFHMDVRGWSDTGYNFQIDQKGNIFEHRGWDVLGAHSGSTSNHHPAVQMYIGGSQEPSSLALESLDYLYKVGNKRYGRTLKLRGHRDYMPTSCPGEPLYKIVRRDYIIHQSVQPALPGSTTPQGDNMTMSAEERKILEYTRDIAIESQLRQGVGNGEQTIAERLDRNYAVLAEMQRRDGWQYKDKTQFAHIEEVREDVQEIKTMLVAFFNRLENGVESE